MKKRRILLRLYIAFLMLSLAVEVDLIPLDVFNLKSIRLSFPVAFIGAAFPIYFFRDFRRFILERLPIISLGILFLLSGAVSALLSAYPATYGLKRLLQYLLFLGISFELLFLISLDRGLGRYFMQIIAALAVFLAVIAVFESTNEGLCRFLSSSFRNGAVEMLEGRSRAGATLRHPNIFGCFMSVGILIFLYLKEGHGMKARLAYPAVLLLGVAMALSGSRNAAFVLIVPLVLLLFNRKTMRAAFAVMTLAVLCLIPLTHSHTRFYDLWEITFGADRPVATAENAGPGSRAASSPDFNTAATRLMLWQSAMDMVRDRPVFGVGPGGFNRALENYASKTLIEVEKEKIRLAYLNAHNGLLNVLAEFGAAGAAFISAFILLPVVRIVRRHGLVPPSPAHAVLLGLALSFGPDAFFYSLFYMVLTVTLYLLFAYSKEDLVAPIPPSEKARP